MIERAFKAARFQVSTLFHLCSITSNIATSYICTSMFDMPMLSFRGPLRRLDGLQGRITSNRVCVPEPFRIDF